MCADWPEEKGMNPASTSFPTRPGDFVTKIKRMFTEQPLIPFGATVTLGFLLAGLTSMRSGDKARSQWMMRGRVAAQGFTVIAIYFGIQAADKVRREQAISDSSTGTSE
jgi:hypothetical protein